jgi:hypothetical protein
MACQSDIVYEAILSFFNEEILSINCRGNPSDN